ncbi:PREDICTED: nucleoporin Nup37 [Nicrophorus vespilloides]|uniref:Nucleoporin Nup37 n=1 Tax=Nicrophorus vespilloides TaxID=110193 RepID=A0ABM1MDP2_NICVS|nr:PREDICTED: nucleoporin Nup37 [Nicrophorus vespilloides]
MNITKQRSDSLTRVDFSNYGNILRVTFSPFEWSQDLLIIAFPNKIIVVHFKYNDTLELQILSEFHYGGLCTAISISPETNILPLNIKFCIANTKEFVLQVFSKEEDSLCKILAGHKSYINDIKYDFENNYIASVSDDCTLKIWSISSNYNCLATFKLSSPGVSTCWHKEDNSKLFVAEKSGIMKFYNINTQSPIISIDICKGLSSADWSPTDSKLVGSLNMGELVFWDITKSSTPRQTFIYSSNGGNIKFSAFGELVACVNKLECSLKVTHTRTMQLKFSTFISLPTNVCWHFKLPILCLGDDKHLCLWKIV